MVASIFLCIRLTIPQAILREKAPWPDACAVSFMSSKLRMVAVASLGESTAEEAVKVVEEIRIKGNKLSWFLHVFPFRVTLSQQALTKSSGSDSRMDHYIWPGPDLVKGTTHWLFINEAQVVVKLLYRDTAGGLNKRFVHAAMMPLPGDRMKYLIHA